MVPKLVGQRLIDTSSNRQYNIRLQLAIRLVRGAAAMKRIVCLGGGPAGLYSAILLRKALPAARVEVYERNRPDDTFGWGGVFSDQTMGIFRTAGARHHRRD